MCKLLNHSVVSIASWVKLKDGRYFYMSEVPFLSVFRCWCLDGNNKILLAVSYQFEAVSPPTAKISKMDNEESDRFAVVATAKIQQACKDAIPMTTKETTIWSTYVLNQWYAHAHTHTHIHTHTHTPLQSYF